MFDTASLIITYGYIGLFAISFLESGIFFLLPGDSLLFSAGLLASSGQINFAVACIMFFTGSFLGSLAGYEIGKRLELLREIKLTRSIFDKVFSERHIAEAHEYFQKKGEFTLLFCRFVPVVRTFTPMVAGVIKMNYHKFVIYNLLGSLVWSMTLTGAGYLLGREFPMLQSYLEYIFAGILLLTVAPVVSKIYKKYKNKKLK